MSLILLKEDEEGRSSSDWRGSEIEDHEPPCHGFDELHENYCEWMLFFDQRRYGCRAMMLEIVAAVPAYLASPKLAHRVVGYLEEEAIHSYIEFLKELDKGKIENVPAPAIVIDYWRLSADSTLRDVVMVVRADEAHHRDVNHFASVYLLLKAMEHELEYNATWLSVKGMDLKVPGIAEEHPGFRYVEALELCGAICRGHDVGARYHPNGVAVQPRARCVCLHILDVSYWNGALRLA
ncbi:hypothetical protein GIB67_009031 [Kingdonia uniflora]|uniref:Ubiquinol oxidase n=1 Tax=Kingdonia uniflora TaxID=39325 RepID=A0A7J7LVU7_9MAGN|nr:hypothetical protein GIB67_009031 [Kingdonia uniflora]